jgi:hypothetical protein
MQAFFPALDQAFIGHFAQDALQLDPVAARHSERSGDLALSGLAGLLRQELEDRFPTGEAGPSFVFGFSSQMGPVLMAYLERACLEPAAFGAARFAAAAGGLAFPFAAGFRPAGRFAADLPVPDLPAFSEMSPTA